MNGLFQNLNHYPFLIAGPCVIENESVIMEVATFMKRLQEKYPGVQLVFKSSFDKANRTSINSFRGPGLGNGLNMLQKVREETSLPVLTDIHESHQAKPVSEVVDIIQIPAFLCRQTDLLLAAGKHGNVINIKKGQFLSGSNMEHQAEKVASTGNENILLTERGTTFGYSNLVVDFRNVEAMKALGYPVVFDATHSVQEPGGAGGHSGGQSSYIPGLAMAAKGIGVNGFFFEIHPNPAEALSDALNMLTLQHFEQLFDALFGN